MNSSEKIREQIIRIRRSKGFSQEYMASEIGISVNSYRKFENGSTMLISPRLEAITKVLESSHEELLFDNATKHRYSLEFEEEHEAYKKSIRSLKKENANLNELISLQKEKINSLTKRVKELEKEINKI